MVKGVPKELSRPTYNSLSIEERKRFWVKLLSENIGVPETEIEARIRRNNSNPVGEREEYFGREDFLDGSRSVFFGKVDDQVVYPRFNANASLLAAGSRPYSGPRGPRPILVTAENICRLSFDEDTEISRWQDNLNKTWGSIDEQISDLQLTASNLRTWKKSPVEFSSEDIRKGIYLSPTFDLRTARALGIIFRRGRVIKNRYAWQLILEGKEKYREFLMDVVPQIMEDAFNVYDPIVNEVGARGTRHIRVVYSGKCLPLYLIHWFGFPQNKSEMVNNTFPGRIRQGSREAVSEFLKLYLATFEYANGILHTNDNFRSAVLAVREMVLGRVSHKSVKSYSQGNSTALNIGRRPTQELYQQGYLDPNATLKRRVEGYLGVNL